MKKWIRPLILSLILVGAFFVLKPYLFPSEEDIIKKTFSHLADEISFSAGTSMVAKMATVDGIRKYFTQDVVLSFDSIHPEVENISGRASVMEMFTLSRTLVSLDVSVTDIGVILSEDKKSATVTLVGKVSLDHSASGHSYQLVQFECVKNENQWQIAKAETLKLL